VRFLMSFHREYSFKYTDGVADECGTAKAQLISWETKGDNMSIKDVVHKEIGK
jgi:hypothetical protein